MACEKNCAVKVMFFLTQTSCFDYIAHTLVEVNMYILIRLSLLNHIFRHVRKIMKNHYYPRHVFPSVRPSVRMQHPYSHRTDFHEILYLSTSRKSV